MIRLDPNPTSLVYAPKSDVDLRCPGHLLVLVSTEVDYSAATQRIWGIAHSTGMGVQLLGLCKDTTEEPALHRKMVTMASLLRDGRISVETNVSIGTDWTSMVKPHYEAGDVIVCFAEQRTGSLRRPLSQVLESNLNATTYILSAPIPQQPRSNPFLHMIAWLGAIAIIIGFGILQANIVRLPEDWLQTVLLMLSIIPEFWLIYIWEARFG